MFNGLREQLKDSGTVYKLPDYSIAHPMMKQQYTYQDLKAAFEAGSALVQYEWDWIEFSYINSTAPSYNDYDEWFKSYKFELAK